MQNQTPMGNRQPGDRATSTTHRKQLGMVWLQDEAEAVGVVEISPAQDAEAMALRLLKTFEFHVKSIGRKDIDLLQVGVCESFARYIPLRPAEGWKPGVLRFRSLAARARPGVAHLLFVLIATPGRGTISYELKVGVRLNPWFVWPMLPIEIIYCLVAGYQHEADIHSGNREREPFIGIFKSIEDRSMGRKIAYLPLITGALAKAITEVESELPRTRPTSPNANGVPRSKSAASPSPRKGRRPEVWD